MIENQKRIILLVEDDEDDFYILQKAILASDPGYEILQASNGWEAITRLQEMELAGHLPCLIVLDVNMPKMDGKHTLVAIQGNKEMKEVPIVILTTSNSALDKLFFKQRGVVMITKPNEYKLYEEVAIRLLHYCKD